MTRRRPNCERKSDSLWYIMTETIPLDRYRSNLKANAKRKRKDDVQDSSTGFHHMISCLLADQASNTFFGVHQALCASHYGQHNTTAIHQERLVSESERSQRRWSCAETAAHQEPSQISRRLLDVQDAQSESKRCKAIALQIHDCSHDCSSAAKRSHDAPTALRWATTVYMAQHQRGSSSKRLYDSNRHNSVPPALLCEISDIFIHLSRPRTLRSHSRPIALGRVRFPLSRSR
jgi:hypothetical protein